MHFIRIPTLLLLALAGCGPDPRQFEVCEALVPALVESGDEPRILDRRAAPDHGVAIAYEVPQEGHSVSGVVHCTFAGGRFDRGRLTLTAITSTATGPLSTVKVYLLRQELAHALGLDLWVPAPDSVPRAGAPRDERALPYLVQQLVNAAIVGSIYALTAIGYTLVYGVIGVINFAYGEIYMLGAFAAVIVFVLLGALGVSWLPLALALVLVSALGAGSLYAWFAERWVFRPLRTQPTRALVAAIALSISLQEYARLTQGASGHWLGRIDLGDLMLVERAGFDAHLTGLQALIIGLAIAIGFTLAVLMTRSRFGREHRAVAQDFRMAAMLGVDVNGSVARTFALGGALAGAAGLIDAAYYGGVGFFMGYIVGFKSLTAALLGGIGSVPGAVLGGFLIGLIETFWAAYFDATYRDVVVFAILVMVLWLRPAGILGVDEPAILRRPV